MSVSFKSNEISLENSTEKIGKDEKLSNESKNPYLNKDCIPEIIKIDKNKIIFANKEEFEIREYLEKINNISNDLLDDDETGLYGESALYIFSLYEESLKSKTSN